MTLGEFWEYDYHFEFKLSHEKDVSRRIIQAIFISQLGSKAPQDIRDIMFLPMIDEPKHSENLSDIDLTDKQKELIEMQAFLANESYKNFKL